MTESRPFQSLYSRKGHTDNFPMVHLLKQFYLYYMRIYLDDFDETRYSNQYFQNFYYHHFCHY